MGALSEFVSFVRTVVAEVRAENVPFMAGSVAYYTFVSIIPLVALLFLAMAVFGDQTHAEQLISAAGSALPPEIATLFRNYLAADAVSGAQGASLIGVVTLLWGALKIFRGLDTAFAEIYGTEGARSFLDRLKDGFVVLVALLLAVLAVVGVTAALSVVTVRGIRYASPVVLALVLVVVLLPIYYRFPDPDVSVREVLPGVVVAAVGWVILQQLFQLYLDVSSASAANIVGAILLLLTWFYFSGLVILLGAVVNAVHGGYRRGTETAEVGGWAANVRG